eukprot:Nk52_evm7s1073 gene=Nk52_evmTU7s1073
MKFGVDLVRLGVYLLFFLVCYHTAQGSTSRRGEPRGRYDQDPKSVGLGGLKGGVHDVSKAIPAKLGEKIHGQIVPYEFTQYIVNYTSMGNFELFSIKYSSNTTWDKPTFFVWQAEKDMSSTALPMDVDECHYTSVSVVSFAADLPKKGDSVLALGDMPYERNVSISVYGRKPNFFSFWIEKKSEVIVIGKTYELDMRVREKNVFVFQIEKESEYKGGWLTFAVTSESDSLAVLCVDEDYREYVYALNTFNYGAVQTFTRKAYITVRPRSVHKLLFVHIVVNSAEGNKCFGRKKMKMLVTESMQLKDYFLPIGVAFGSFSLFFVIAAVFHFKHLRMREQEVEQLTLVGEKQPINSSEEAVPRPTDSPVITEKSPLLPAPTAGEPSGSSISKRNSRARAATSPLKDVVSPRKGSEPRGSFGEYDKMNDMLDDKYIVRTNPDLRVSHLSRKDEKQYEKKIKHYFSNIVILAIFYFLPAVQLVFSYQSRFMDGEQDLCFYNFECSRPVGKVQQFNNVYSNLGYVMVGILFLCLVRIRSNHSKELRKVTEDYNIPERLERGLPKHYGVFYAIGFALVCEGVFSATYHLCPTKDNFQFDTSFMYIIAGLLMLAMYQKRHPDITSNPHTAYGFFAAVIFCNFLGVYFNNGLFWTLMFFCFGIASCYFTAQIYFLGLWSLDKGVFQRFLSTWRQDTSFRFNDRLIFLVVGNVLNWAFFIYGILFTPVFSVFLLGTLISNVFLYFFFYLAMKIKYEERIGISCILCLVLAAFFWSSGTYFFELRIIDWELTPWNSRARNAPCVLMDFYDAHDIWHFLSAAALFFSSVVILILDDDLDSIPRKDIQVF